MEFMFMLQHGTTYVIYAPYIQRIINYKTDIEFIYDEKYGAYQPHVIQGLVDPPPPAAAIVGISVAAPASPPARAPSAASELSHAATCRGKKQNILIKGLNTLISMCRSNDTLIHESHQ
jgi:hypothetical protein